VAGCARLLKKLSLKLLLLVVLLLLMLELPP
jgi:hypothetical protein